MYKTGQALFQHFKDNHEQLVEQYNGKSIILHDFKVIKAYDNFLEAAKYAVKNLEAGTFIVQRVAPGEDSYTRWINSSQQYVRVA